MAMLKMFSVWDAKAESFARPFFDVSKGSAIRSFSDIAKDSSHVIGQHPADFSLFELGEWDDKKCVFHPLTAPVNLGTALEFNPSVVSQLKDVSKAS